MTDACTGCGAPRPKGAHWFYVYADTLTGKRPTPTAIYCRKCRKGSATK